MKTFLSCCLLLAVLAAPMALASAMTVPVDVQLEIFTNVWNMDRSFTTARPVTMAIVFQDVYGESVDAKDDVIAAVDRLKLPIRCVPIECGTQERLRKALSEVRADVVYVAPLRAVAVEEIGRICRQRSIRSCTGVEGYVEIGIAVGIGLKRDRPLIIINLRAARAEGASFNAQLLNLARIVGPLS